MNFKSLIITSLVAGATGAIAGTLFAPKKGAKTRKNIANKSQEYKDFIFDNYNDFAETVSHPFEGMEDQTIRLSKKAINKAEKMKESLMKSTNDKH